MSAPAKINLSPRRGPGARRRVPPPRDGLPGDRPARPGHRVPRALLASDDVTVTVTAEDRISLDDVPLDGSNIAVRAARLLADHHGVERGVALGDRQGHPGRGRDGRRQRRRAPRRCWPATTCGACAPRARTLIGLAAELGSDVPFALVGGTAIGSGRGEVVTPLMTRGEYWWVVLESPVGLSTPAVYARVRRAARPAAVGDPEIPDDLMQALRTHDVAGAGGQPDQRPPAGRAPAASRAPGGARARARRVGARRRCCPAPARAACSCARARRTPSWSPPACGPAGSPPSPRARARARRPHRPRREALTWQPRPTWSASSACTRRTASGPSSTASASASAPASGSASSAATATARPRSSSSSAVSSSADDGRVSRNRGLHLGYLTQGDDLDPSATVGEAVLEGRAEHEWAADSATREVVEVLLAGVPLDRVVEGLSGGERRRCSLARLLLGDHDLVVLDEPTNHLDVEAVAWLAQHLARRTSALVVVTHDRWFLDAVCTTTWEVHDGVVDVYDGGYAAFVLAKAERQRQAAASESRRQNLMRKELAWLRRGAPARTSKPKFRIDAASALIEDEPPPRDRLELQRFATQRLGKDVVDVEDVDLVRGDKTLLSHATWRLGPGDRFGLVGVNGAGKTSVLRLVAGELSPSKGRVKQGRTVALEHLTQALDHLDPTDRVLDSVEKVQRVTKLAGSGRRDHRVLDAGAVRVHRRPADGAHRRPVRWRATALPDAAAAALGAQRAAARRAHQRPRHRDADRARGLPRRLARDARRGLARPLLPGAGHRRDLRPARRRPGLDAAARGGGVPRATGRRPRPPRSAPGTPAGRLGPEGVRRRDPRGPQGRRPHRQAAAPRSPSASRRCTPSWSSTPPTTSASPRSTYELRELADQKDALEEQWLSAATVLEG